MSSSVPRARPVPTVVLMMLPRYVNYSVSGGKLICF